MTFNVVDAIAVLLIAVAVVFGWRSGFVIQAFALAGFVVGLVLIVLFAPHLAGLLADAESWLRASVVIVFVAGSVLVLQMLGSAMGGAIRRRVGDGFLGRLDAGAGAAFGFLRGLFLVWLLGGLLGVLPVNLLASEARQSLILRAIDTRVPSPVVLAAELGRIIEAAGLPAVLVGAPPPIDLPVGGPSAEEAEQIAAAARASTVRVESTACGNFLTGSGFAVDVHYVVTNAHVVAGSDRTWISFDGALDRHSADVVSFDPDLDAALLYVEDVTFEPLELAGQAPGRGEPAATLGFTGGGRLRLIPAVVSRVLDALGRDIYGGEIVTRDVIELREDVAPGDSGGPLVMPSGRVGGLTFSESQSDTSIGYALTPDAVAQSISGALGSEEPVSTGACLA